MPDFSLSTTVCNSNMRSYVRQSVKIATLLLLAAAVALPQSRSDRYVVILKDRPVAAVAKSRKTLATKAAVDRRQLILRHQTAVRTALTQRGIRIGGSMNTLANALFIGATPAQAAEIAKLPGVMRVVPDLPAKRHLNAALDIIRAQQAWNQVGGKDSAGAGIGIAILDTGIDQNHPALQDSSLSYPAGFPKGDTNFTNTKVVTARSYVDMLQFFDSSDPTDWRPDDLSPRDRVGHGTAAAMIAAGGTVQGPVATITGVAPKAQLGNYKIFGSPGVNDVTTSSVIAKALEDAYNDGFDIAMVTAGSPALWGPNDAGATCGLDPGVYCDWRVDAVEIAIGGGMVVVTSAGNDGDLGSNYPDVPSFGSVNSPGTAPDAITVGSSTNSHVFYQTLTVQGSDFHVLSGNGPNPGAPLTADIVDVASTGNDGKACTPLANGSLDGDIALIARGDCAFDTKVLNAQNAGAVAAIIYLTDSNSLFAANGLEETGIPMFMIGKDDADRIKNLTSGGNRQATIDPTWVASNGDSDTVAYFSSIGPSLGEEAIKPELLAPGTDLYVATQSYDPNGDMYDASGFTVAQGTSFSAAMVAGAAALVLQKNPQFGPIEVKSALVNTTNGNVSDFDASGNRKQASVIAMGSGRLNAETAVGTNVTVEPAVLSFGAVQSLPLPKNASLTFTNWGTSTVTLTLALQPRGSDPAQMQILPDTTVQIPGSTTRTVTIPMQATSVPASGIYEGFIVANGGAVQLRIPYLYVTGDGVPANMVPLVGNDFVTDQNAGIGFTLRVTDKYGVGVPDLPVKYRATSGGGGIDLATDSTDALGISEVIQAHVGSQIGEQSFQAYLDNSDLTYDFLGRVFETPSISSPGVVNAASFASGSIAPGSYITIWGNGLSEGMKHFTTSVLPYSLMGVSISFDIPEKNESYAARPTYVSDGQINVQVPWELAGETSADLKVSIGSSTTAAYPVTIAAASPASFEWNEPAGHVIAVAQDADYNLISNDNPAERGQVIMIYANGLGPVNDPPPTGEPAARDPLSQTLTQPAVTIGGRTATVEYSGLSPESIGLYQLNVRVPADIDAGYQPVVISVNGVQSKTVDLPIR